MWKCLREYIKKSIIPGNEVERRIPDLKFILNNVPQMLWISDKYGNFEFINKRWLDYAGVAFEEAKRRGIKGFIHPDDLPDRLVQWEQSIANKTEFKVQNRIKDKNGDYKWFLSKASPIIYDNEIIRWLGMSIDIQEQKEKEEEIRIMLDGLPDMAWAANMDGLITYFNKSWISYTGYNLEETLMGAWSHIQHPDDIEETQKKWNKSLRKREPFERVSRFRSAEGEYRWHLARANIVDMQNKDLGEMWVGTITDIHDKKIYQEQLEVKNTQLIKINEDLDSFVYTASHDLKAPIVNIEGILMALEHNIAENNIHEIQVFFEMMKKSVDKLKSVITQLSDISKLQHSFEEEQKERISISSIVSDIKETISKSIVDTYTVFEEEYKIDQINFSRRNFYSIIFNIISNSIKYRHPKRKPKIKIKTCREGNGFLIYIRDNGIGISKKDKDKVFGLFKRLHSHVEGAGIGLYMVKRIVQNSGGKIELETDLNKGTLFKIYLPLE